MQLKPLLAPLCASLSDFVLKPMDFVGRSGASSLAILDANQPVFYVVSPETFAVMVSRRATGDQEPPQQISESVLTQGTMRLNRFDALAEKLIGLEQQRASRGELSKASIGILRNRLDAHVLPFFKYIPPSQVTSVQMEAFVQRLTESQLSSTTVSQYLVVVRKLLKLAIRHGFLREIPELPSVKVANRPRSMLSLKEYAAVVRTAHRLSRWGSKAPEIKSTGGHRERFWVQTRHLHLPPDMAWAIRFMVNSFVRPGDIRQLKHRHVQVVRGTSVYFPRRVIPMLPEKLSNGLCSLRPNEDKCTFSAVFELDKKGKIVKEWFGRTLIHSDRRFAYEDAQVLIEHEGPSEDPYEPVIKDLNRIAKTFRDARFKHGSVNFDSTELRFLLDEDGKPIAVYPRERKDAHKLIEEFMLLANKKVAEYVHELKQTDPRNTMVYRIHDAPDPEKLRVFSSFASASEHRRRMLEIEHTQVGPQHCCPFSDAARLPLTW